MQTKVIIEFDTASFEIRKMIHPDDDSQIAYHVPDPGNAHVYADHELFPVRDGKPDYGLVECEDAVEKITGRRPKRAL